MATSDLLARFLEGPTYEKQYSAHTVAAYAQDLRDCTRYLSAHYESALAAATPVMLRSWLLQCAEQGIQARSINRKIASLRSFFKFLGRRGYTEKNPTLRLRNLPVPKTLPAYVKEDEMHKLLDNTAFPDTYEGIRDKTIIALLYGAGLRRSELVKLQISDFSPETNHLKVQGKGNKERLIPLPQGMKTEMEQYLCVRQKSFGDSTLSVFFFTDKGQPLYDGLVYRIVQKYLSGATVTHKKSPHVLRHSYATHLLDRGAELNAIKELLGHSSLAATQVYTHNSLKKLKKIYQQAHPKA